MLRNRVISGRLHVLIKWKNQPSVESSWEDAETFQKLYPKFQLKDELILSRQGEMSYPTGGLPEVSPEVVKMAREGI